MLPMVNEEDQNHIQGSHMRAAPLNSFVGAGCYFLIRSG